jgi:hypothetical protein
MIWCRRDFVTMRSGDAMMETANHWVLPWQRDDATS